MRRLKIEHTTTYHYSESVAFLPHRLILRPREGPDVRIENSILEMTPAHQIRWQRDVYNNSVGVISFLESATQLSIYSEVLIQSYEDAPLDFIVSEYAVNFPFRYRSEEQVDLMPYQLPVFPKDSDAIAQWVGYFWKPGWVLETYVLLDQLNKAISQELNYAMREAPGVQTPAKTLNTQSGSCRDFATLFIEACRYLGLAARFVSGYQQGPATEAGPGATHAWAEIYLPGAGWKGFDPTHGEVVGNQHIAVAVHRDPEAVPPVSGAFAGQLSQPPELKVEVRVSAS